MLRVLSTGTFLVFGPLSNLREFIALRALDNAIQDEDVSVVGALEDENILELGAFVVEDAANLQAHRLTGPLLRALLVDWRPRGRQKASIIGCERGHGAYRDEEVGNLHQPSIRKGDHDMTKTSQGCQLLRNGFDSNTMFLHHSPRIEGWVNGALIVADGEYQL